MEKDYSVNQDGGVVFTKVWFSLIEGERYDWKTRRRKLMTEERNRKVKDYDYNTISLI